MPPSPPSTDPSDALNASARPVDALAAALDADLRDGLSAPEASRRLARDGPNALRAKPRVSAWRRLAGQFVDPLVGLLLAATAIALIVWSSEGFKGVPYDAIVILTIVVLNALLGYLQEAKAERAVTALARMTEATSLVRRDGTLQRVSSADLVIGDLLVLSEGDAVGADARLLEASDLQVQEAALSGESLPVVKQVAELPAGTALAEQRNMVFKGTAVNRGTGLALVTATGMQSEVGAIAEMLAATQPPPTPLQREIARVGRRLGVAVLVISALVVALVASFSTLKTLSDLVPILLLGVSLAVAAVPEGLPAILSVALALGVQRMAARGAIVRRLSSVETLGCASVICTDKTGTLTRSEMTLVRMLTASGLTQVTGVGYTPAGELLPPADLSSTTTLREEQRALLCAGSLAGNAALQQGTEGDWRILGDPTEAAFLVAERKLDAPTGREARYARLAELAFTSERKRMSVLLRDLQADGGLLLTCKGAPDLLLARCTRIRIGTEDAPLDPEWRARIQAGIDALSDDALRTLGVACRRLEPEAAKHPDPALEVDLVWLGVAGIEDPARDEAAPAVAQAHAAGVRVVMITGDHPRTAARIAATLGIDTQSAQPLSGDQLEAMDDATLASAVGRCNVFARVTPAHKLRIVKALRTSGAVVAMTGDGVNDAPALKASHIGIAMGINGTEVAKEAADMVLADDNFATIVRAVREGRAIFDDIAKVLRYLLSSNLGEVLTILLGVLGAGLLGLQGADGLAALPLLATQILWINLMTDSWPALAMGVDPPLQDPMAQPPRDASRPIIDAAMWSTVIQTGLVMALCTLLAIDWQLPGGFLEGNSELDAARTVGFTTLVFAQLFNCFASRSAHQSALRRLFTNRWLWLGIGLSILLQVLVVELAFLNRAFGTVPLDATQWIGCVVAGSGVLWYSEATKSWVRRPRSGRRGRGPRVAG